MERPLHRNYWTIDLDSLATKIQEFTHPLRRGFTSGLGLLPSLQPTGAAPFVWGPEQQQAFDDIKRALLSAPALVLPDVTKPFVLLVDERSGVAQGVLTQQ